MKQKITLILSFSMILLSACSGHRRTATIVAGSTSVQPYIEVLAELYAVSHPDDAIDVQGGGSSAGVRAALEGTADVGMSSRDLVGAELDMWNIEIAKDGLAIIIHPRNELDNLTFDQVRGIYSGEITRWSDVGGSDSRIHVITREEGSGTRSAFESMVMDDVMITPKAIVQDSNGAVLQLVLGDINSIGFVSLGLVDSTVKALNLNGVAASWENVMNGSYTLYRPFIFVTVDEPEGLAKQFIDFTMSPEGQKVLVEEGLVTNIEGT
jgi:phosphate transport system substrate-binding protein